LGCSVFLIACGGYSSSSGTGVTTSGLTNRAFVSNQFSGAIDIIDASTDKLNTHRIIGDSNPTIMSLSPDKKATLVFTAGTDLLDVISNKDESVAGKLQLLGQSESFFFLPDNKTVYVAVRNTAAVVAWDTSAGTTPSLTVPNVRWLAHSNNGKVVLAFPDDNSGNVYPIDTTTSPPTVKPPVAGFDHPVFAVFSSDDSKAYVLNCGPECGGTTAGIQVLDVASLTLSGAAVPVPGGATHALLNSSTLYVTGTPQPAPACVNNVNSPSCGRLTVVDVSAAPSVGNSYEIVDGFHDHMLMAPNNRVYVGSEFTCTAVRPSGNGCLSIYNTSANTVASPVVCGSACNGLADVTGMTNITQARTDGRKVVYVVEGGEVHVYDTATGAQIPGVVVDTSGRSWDVVAPD
jgi:hypothetical protein